MAAADDGGDDARGRAPGPFQVQTIAAHPDKLNVKRELFEALGESDRQLLLDRGVVTETRFTSQRAHRSTSHTRPCRGAPDLRRLRRRDAAGVMPARREAGEGARGLKAAIKERWEEGTKIVSPARGPSSSAGRPPHFRVRYSCAGRAAFARELSAAEQRFEDVFAPPAEPLLHVRGQHVGVEHGERLMTVNHSGRALLVSYGGARSCHDAAVLPTHAFASRRNAA